MSGCPFHSQNKLRADLPALPARIARLPVDERGYPVPFFVSWPDGKPEFRLADAQKMKLCVIQHLCWVCGQKIRGLRTFTVGPMCVVNRNSGEPPAHPECAEFSVLACPFMTKPQMDRREDDFTRTHGQDAGGVMLKRNPGVVALWTCLTHTPYKDPVGGQLFRFGDALEVTWWREGRPALRAEILESIDSGIPLLAKHCRDARDLEKLNQWHAEALKYLPHDFPK